MENKTTNFLDLAIESVRENGGNPFNLDCLKEIAKHIDSYAIENKTPFEEGIYTSRTSDLFMKLVDSIASDEINNNNIYHEPSDIGDNVELFIKLVDSTTSDEINTNK
jgi:hypothetical protein